MLLLAGKCTLIYIHAVKIPPENLILNNQVNTVTHHQIKLIVFEAV